MSTVPGQAGTRHGVVGTAGARGGGLIEYRLACGDAVVRYPTAVRDSPVECTRCLTAAS